MKFALNCNYSQNRPVIETGTAGTSQLPLQISAPARTVDSDSRDTWPTNLAGPRSLAVITRAHWIWHGRSSPITVHRRQYRTKQCDSLATFLSSSGPPRPWNGNMDPHLLLPSGKSVALRAPHFTCVFCTPKFFRYRGVPSGLGVLNPSNWENTSPESQSTCCFGSSSCTNRVLSCSRHQQPQQPSPD